MKVAKNIAEDRLSVAAMLNKVAGKWLLDDIDQCMFQTKYAKMFER